MHRTRRRFRPAICLDLTRSSRITRQRGRIFSRQTTRRFRPIALRRRFLPRARGYRRTIEPPFAHASIIRSQRGNAVRQAAPELIQPREAQNILKSRFDIPPDPCDGRGLPRPRRGQADPPGTAVRRVRLDPHPSHPNQFGDELTRGLLGNPGPLGEPIDAAAGLWIDVGQSSDQGESRLRDAPSAEVLEGQFGMRGGDLMDQLGQQVDRGHRHREYSKAIILNRQVYLPKHSALGLRPISGRIHGARIT